MIQLSLEINSVKVLEMKRSDNNDCEKKTKLTKYLEILL